MPEGKAPLQLGFDGDLGIKLGHEPESAGDNCEPARGAVYSKSNPSAPAPAGVLTQAAAEVDFLITGLGD